MNAVYLFGSFARGEGKLPDSDIEAMVVLESEFNYWKTDERASKSIAGLSPESDVVISIKLASQSKYLLDLADESHAVARVLMERGFARFSAAQSHYTIFYLAQALLLTKGLTFSSHAAVAAPMGSSLQRQAY